jgi:hypothetical protein
MRYPNKYNILLKEKEKMPKLLAQKQHNIIQKLDHELSRFKVEFQIAHNLKVKWLPNDNSKKSGEVLNEIIYIYEKDKVKALDTLKHEFIEYALTHELEIYYKKLINKFISLFEEEMYERKEKFIEKILKLI